MLSVLYFSGVEGENVTEYLGSQDTPGAFLSQFKTESGQISNEQNTTDTSNITYEEEMIMQPLDKLPEQERDPKDAEHIMDDSIRSVFIGSVDCSVNTEQDTASQAPDSSSPEAHGRRQSKRRMSKKSVQFKESPVATQTKVTRKKSDRETDQSEHDAPLSPQDTPAKLQAKKTMLKNMGLTEKTDIEDAASSPQRSRSSSRRCSVPVWLDLIPKRSRKGLTPSSESQAGANRSPSVNKLNQNKSADSTPNRKKTDKEEKDEQPSCSSKKDGKSSLDAGRNLRSKRLADVETKSETVQLQKSARKKIKSEPQDLQQDDNDSSKSEETSSDVGNRKRSSRKSVKEEADAVVDNSNEEGSSECPTPGESSKDKKIKVKDTVPVCDKCGKIFSTNQNLNRHRITHNDFKAYKCSFCQQRFHYPQYLRDHVVVCRLNPEPSRRVYKDHDRARPSPRLKKLVEVIPCPEEEGTYINKIPERMLTTLANTLERAAKNNESRENDSENMDEMSNKVKRQSDGKYLCLVCNKTIMYEVNLRRHLATHAELKPYKCIYCEKRFANAQYLKDHVIACKKNSTRLPVSSRNQEEATLAKRNVIIIPSVVEEGTFINAEIEESEEESIESDRRGTKTQGSRKQKVVNEAKKKEHLLGDVLTDVYNKQKKLGDIQKRRHPKMRKPYRCTVCKGQFSCAALLRKHLTTHESKTVLTCEICSKKFNVRRSLKKHVFKVHFKIKTKTMMLNNAATATSTSLNSSEDKLSNSLSKVNEDEIEENLDDKETDPDFKDTASPDGDDGVRVLCDVCGESFRSARQLQQHSKLHGTEEQQKLTCQYCKKTFCLESTFAAHLCRSKSHEKTAVLYQCVDCTSKFFKQENLIWHQYITHGVKSFNKCPICSVAIEKGTLLEHIEEIHTVKKKKSEPKESIVFKCSMCNIKFNKEYSLMLHKKTHENMGEYMCPKDTNVCPICFMSFSSFGNMRRHYRVVHHDDKPFMCDICGKAFKTKDTMKSHAMIHNRAEHLKFKCKTCGKAFFKNRGLRLHETVHMGLITCMCDFCGKRFRLKGNLKKHIQSVHMEERNEVCQLCGKMFKLKEQLQHHMRLHVIREGRTQEVGKTYGKIYTCDLCNKHFPSSYSLKLHKASHSSDRPFVCDLCGQGFKVKSKLKRHHQTVHLGIRKSGSSRSVNRTRAASVRPQFVMVKSEGSDDDKEKEYSIDEEVNNAAEQIVEVFVNGGNNLKEESEMKEEAPRMYSLVDHTYRPATSAVAVDANSTYSAAVIEEAVKGMTQLSSGEQSEMQYIIQDIEEIQDQQDTYIVTDGGDGETNLVTDDATILNLSVEEGPKTVVYYITTDQ